MFSLQAASCSHAYNDSLLLEAKATVAKCWFSTGPLGAGGPERSLMWFECHKKPLKNGGSGKMVGGMKGHGFDIGDRGLHLIYYRRQTWPQVFI